MAQADAIATAPTNTGLCSYLFSTIGRKQLMALTGLGWCLFVLTHAAGNMLLFVGPEAYNHYSHALITNPFIYVAEGGLVAMLLLHIFEGFALTFRNNGARKVKFAVQPSGPKKTSLAKKTLIWQGTVILVFIILHLITFKYGKVIDVEYSGVKMRDLFSLVHEVFQSPLYVVWYVVAVVIMCFHLSHGFYSSLQTLGLNHPKYSPALQGLSVGYAILVTAMFAAQPIYMLCFYRG